MVDSGRRGKGGDVHDQSRVAPVEQEGCRKRHRRGAKNGLRTDCTSSQGAQVVWRMVYCGIVALDGVVAGARFESGVCLGRHGS